MECCEDDINATRLRANSGRRKTLMSEGKGMQALKVATIVMAVLIVLGTVTLLVLLARRSAGPSAPAVVTVPAGAAAFSATLAEPEGTRIVGVSEGGDRLAVQLQGGGPDRVVLVDPHTGVVVGRVGLAH
jgi:hypothetical protein